ncbi:MAG: hypothetical protein HY657_13950 [Acidobacteria bacterium]|nr:hypothetical protein [Acidobacteriota bacterium]
MARSARREPLCGPANEHKILVWGRIAVHTTEGERAVDFLASIENSGLMTWLRESPSVLAYPTLLAFHTFGMAFLVGSSSALALRCLGVARDLPLGPMNGLFSVVHAGLWVSALSGLLLILIDARTFLTMPAFYIKMAAIVGALVLMWSLRAEVFARAGATTVAVSHKGRVQAATMLVLWLVATTAGRVTAYAPFIGWETAGAVLVTTIVLLAGVWVVSRLMRPAHPVSSRSSVHKAV